VVLGAARASVFEEIVAGLGRLLRANSRIECVALTLLFSKGMVDKRRGRDSFEESLERALDKGVSLPAADRLAAMTTRNGEDQLGVVVRSPQPSPEPAFHRLP